MKKLWIIALALCSVAFTDEAIFYEESMDVKSVQDFEKRQEADLLVIPFWQKGKEVKVAANLDSVCHRALDPISSGDFTGKRGETIFLYEPEEKEKRLVLLGLGEEADVDIETIRRAYGKVGVLCLQKRYKSLNLAMPKSRRLSREKLIQSMLEGLHFANYRFDYKTQFEEERTLIEEVTLLGLDAKERAVALKISKIFTGVNLSRDLVNENADTMTPEALADIAKKLAKSSPKVETKVLGKEAIEKAKMGLFLAVNRGSPLEPKLIIVKYSGNPRSKEHTVIVGKGVTYDTGGLSLKPTKGMETMKCDMGGASVALGVIQAAASINLKSNITAVIAATENSIDGLSYKVGDVYTSMNGKTVEVNNTDAEGRLTLADALTYAAQKLEPTRIIDFATLTGAIEIALGRERAGLFSNDTALEKAIFNAGEKTGEKVWPMPMDSAYHNYLKTDIADIGNAKERSGGSITAACFLREFVADDMPWAHLDIANTCFLSKGKCYHTTPATGFGVRLIIQLLEEL